MALARTFRWFILTLILLVIIAGAVAGWGYAGMVRPGPLVTDRTIIIPRGVGVQGIAALLAAERVVSSPALFRVAARTIGREKILRAGEFNFPRRVSLRNSIEILHKGETVVRRLTIAEGLTSREILAQLERTDGLTGRIAQPPAEGALLPETYHFSYGDGRPELLARMRAGRHRLLQQLWSERAPQLPLSTPEEAVILASIIEKETARADERPRIAGVFINRLRRGMRLQSDPTVVYGLTEGRSALGRPLTRRDLKSVTPYNTYVIPGLPPTPISNPGRASLEAVLNPAVTGDLYFVADGAGGHAFAQTLAEHNRNVANWRKRRRQQRAAE